MSSIEPNALPYRSGVGIVLLNAQGLIWLGRRFAELELQERWQMPQGGIDKDEEPRVAAMRELQEETGVRSVAILAESKGWIQYDLPPEAVGKALKGKYRGQRQRWFAMRFTGDEREINLQPEGLDPEFDAWRWSSAVEVLGTVVNFKRGAYETILSEFAHLLAP
jgi:putative (di)nucleoside polyphosphate hydrolase